MMILTWVYNLVMDLALGNYQGEHCNCFIRIYEDIGVNAFSPRNNIRRSDIVKSNLKLRHLDMDNSGISLCVGVFHITVCL